MSALSIHKDNSLKLVLAPEVETSVKSVGLAVPQISVRPVELSRPTIATLTNCLTILPRHLPGRQWWADNWKYQRRGLRIVGRQCCAAESGAPSNILLHRWYSATLVRAHLQKPDLYRWFFFAKEPFTRSNSQLQFCSRLLSGYWSMVTLLWSLIMTWHYKTAKC